MIKEETLLLMLPGFNCGACGYVNCATFASALKEKRASKKALIRLHDVCSV